MTSRMRAPEGLRRSVQQIEDNEHLDLVVDIARPVGDAMGTGRAGEILRGEWLGHALHPLMTDLPLGCWVSAGLLDLVGGKGGRPAARKLTALGLVFVPATVASGWADWSTVTDQRTKRVGVVHAVGNVGVATLYFLSWRARRREHHFRGKILGLLGATLAMGTGYLGGHMAFAPAADADHNAPTLTLATPPVVPATAGIPIG